MPLQNIDKRRISTVAGVILVTAAIFVGVTVFYVMKLHAEHLLGNSLQASLQNNVELADSETRQGLERAVMVATRPFLIDQIQLVNSHGGGSATLQTLDRGAHSFLSSGISAVALYSEDGREVARAGSFVEQPALALSVNLAEHTQLLFKEGYFLRADVNIVKSDRVIGRAIVETPLPVITAMFKNASRLGKTGELVLCKLMGNKMQCFPSTLHSQVLSLALRSPEGVPLPMTHALEGLAGFVTASDYRHHEVAAAYSPVGNLGLGMVLKMDSAELYAPVWNQLRYLLPLLGGVMAVALLLLRWLFTPLVTRLVRSEQEALAANAQLQDSENRVRMLLDNLDEGIVNITATGVIELFNPAAERMFGYQSADIIGRNVSLLMSEPHRSRHDGYLQHYLDTGESQVIGISREVEAQRSNGEIFPMELRVSEFFLEGRRQFIGIMRDITERKAAEAKIVHLALHDALTGLPNRRLVQDRIQHAIASARRSGTHPFVMFVDLDKFKIVNDTFGHAVGDQLLQMVADRLTRALRAEDTIGRQGGDEFLVLATSTGNAKDTALLAQKIVDVLSEPFIIDGQALRIGASVGIAVFPQDGDDVETLLKNSDTAMYYAKEAGRSNYQFFTPNMNASIAS